MDIQQQLKQIREKRVKLHKEKIQLQKAITILDKELENIKLTKIREDLKSKK